MKRDFKFWQWLGFSITTLLGTFLHFLYEWTDNNKIAAIVSGVNESTWEHMKLLFFPLFLFALLQRCFLGKTPNFWCIKLFSTSLGLVMIPVIFYTYNGAFGPSPDWLNISIFFMAAAISFGVERKLMTQRVFHSPSFSHHCFLALCFLGTLFLVFTFFPPQIPLFLDPVTKSYGIPL